MHDYNATNANTERKRTMFSGKHNTPSVAVRCGNKLISN